MDLASSPEGMNSTQAGADVATVAGELRRESDRLAHLAAQLEEANKKVAEVERDNEHYRRAVYTSVIAQFDQEPQLRDADLEILIAEENAEPLDSFIHELEDLIDG